MTAHISKTFENCNWKLPYRRNNPNGFLNWSIKAKALSGNRFGNHFQELNLISPLSAPCCLLKFTQISLNPRGSCVLYSTSLHLTLFQNANARRLTASDGLIHAAATFFNAVSLNSFILSWKWPFRFFLISRPVRQDLPSCTSSAAP